MRHRWLEHLQGKTFWIELDQGDFGLLRTAFQASPLIDPILEHFKHGRENLDIILWALRNRLPMNDVLEILEALDVNSRRIECRFDPRRSGARPDTAFADQSLTHPVGALGCHASRYATNVLTKQPVAAGIAGRVVGIAPARPGDIEVDPRRRADELFEKLGRRDGPAPFSADVLQVGDVALELLLVIVVERQPPDALARSGGWRRSRLGETRRRC